MNVILCVRVLWVINVTESDYFSIENIIMSSTVCKKNIALKKVGIVVTLFSFIYHLELSLVHVSGSF